MMMQESCSLFQRLRALQATAAIFACGTALFAAWQIYDAIPTVQPGAIADTELKLGLAGENQSPASYPPARWQAEVFARQSAPPAFTGELAQHYRLAGTFFAVADYRQSRKAIIDDLRSRDQKLVGEGDMLETDGQGVLVATIHNDHVVLKSGNHQEKIWLSFSGTPPTAIAEDSQATAESVDSSLEMLTRFGKRVEDRRWLLNRDALLGYYQELMADTERLAKVFESMKPVYQQSRISGYVLDIEGEKDMFNAFGLRQNDVIRKVNSMPMTSQNRAEYFIREFVSNRVNGFVLDIERDGNPQKFVYLIR